jgi:hypothetical protein
VSEQLKCWVFEDYAERLVIALAPLRELIKRECFELERRGFSEEDFYRRVIRELMTARFGEPYAELVGGENSIVVYRLSYKCMSGEEEREARVEVIRTMCGVLLGVYTVEAGAE